MPVTTRPMSKSPNAVAAQAFEVAKRSLPSYSAMTSPKLYTQHQLFAVLVLRQFFKTDLRGIVAILEDSTDLRKVIGLRRVPHFSTLSYAEKRFLKGGLWPPAPSCGSAGSDSGSASARE
jgi:Transposase domain (DUF772)